MGKPVDFTESNFIWKGYPTAEEHPDVDDLPSWRSEHGSHTVSCWKLSLIERLLVLVTGRVWLHVMGTQPPMYAEGHRPFRKDSSP